MIYQNKKTKLWAYDTKRRKDRKHIRKSGFKTKHDAELAELIAIENDTISTNIFLYDCIDHFLEEQKTFKAGSTAYTYRERAKHLYLYMRNARLDKITKNDVIECREKMVAAGVTNCAINNSINLLKQILNFACKKEIIKYNPIAGLEPLPHQKEIKEYMTLDEYKKIMEVENDVVYKTLWTVMFFCGIRKGERTLKWKDVDFENKVIHIRTHIIESGEKDSIEVVSGRKRGPGIIVSLDNESEKQLKQLKEYYRNFDGFSEEAYVFGLLKVIPRTTLARHLKEVTKKAGINKNITPHSNRHSMASLAYQAGVSTQVIADRLGDTPEMVHKTYGHLKVGADREIADLFSKMQNGKDNKEN